MNDDQGVGLFIDFDNIRYSLLNERGEELDPKELMDKAKQYGRVVTAKAYADFSEHPPEFRRSLEVAGIDVRDIPKGGVIKNKSKKSSPEIAMVLDIFEFLLDKPAISTLVMMSGDRDLIRMVTMARHRFSKHVVICGVPEAISRDLANAADTLDPLRPRVDEVSFTPPEQSTSESIPVSEVTEEEIKLIRSVEYHKDRPFRSFNFLAEKAASERNPNRVGDLEAAKRIIEAAVRDGILFTEEADTGHSYTITSYSLNEEHPRVQAALNMTPQEGDAGEADEIAETNGDAE